MTDKPVWTLDQIVSNLDRAGYAWLEQPVTYSFLNAVPPDDRGHDYAGYSAFTATERGAVGRALSLYADVANITFTPGADSSNSNNKITFANSSTMPNYVWGWTQPEWGSHSIGGENSIDSMEVWVNSAGGLSDFSNGTYDFTALMHEIGHTLGLSHPGDYNADGSTITYDNNAEYQQDSRQYTIMSYFDASYTGANHGSQYASTPLIDDVAALQAIYGANMATRAGDTVYGFNSTAGESAYDFSQDGQPVVAIWDGGGTDTIDLSGYTMGCNLDLNAGAFSDVGGLTKNLAICYGVTIENAVGGSGDDAITGNDVANVISPGAGNATVYGGAGDDTIVFDGAQLTSGDHLDGGDGMDTLQFIGSNSSAGLSQFTSIEIVRIADSSTWVVPGSYYGIIEIIGSDGNDTIDASHVGGQGAVPILIEGGAGDDTLTAGSNTTLLPGTGNDTLYVGGGGVVQFASISDLTAADTISPAPGINGATIQFLTSGVLDASQLAGVSATVSFKFADGDDSFVSPNTLVLENVYGGDGNDTLDISQATQAEDDARVYGGDGNDTLTGNGRADILSGDDGNDVIYLNTASPSAHAYGGAGNDVLYADPDGNPFVFDGGTGNDTLVLDGDYNGGTVNDANIETLQLTAGHDYTFDSGTSWLVDASALSSHNRLTLDEHGEVGAVDVKGGAGNDVIITGFFGDTISAGNGNDTVTANAGDDRVFGGAGNDVLDAGTGHDKVYGGNGKDLLSLGADFTVDDKVVGGNGGDTLHLDGDYSAGLAITPDMMKTVEAIVVDDGFSYDFTLAQGVVSHARKFTVDGSDLGAGHSLHFSAAAETGGNFLMIGGAGADVLLGGGGKDLIKAGAGNDTLQGGGSADVLYGGSGANIFVYSTAGDSTGKACDKIEKFDAAADAFHLWFAVNALDAAVSVHKAGDVAAALDATHLAAGDAVLVTLKSGGVFVAVDANGVAGYQAGEDLLIQLQHPTSMAQFTIADFI